MRILKTIFFISSVIILALGLFLLWSLRPALPPEKFPLEAIVQIPLTEKNMSSFEALEEDFLTVVTYNMGYASGAKNNQGQTLNQTEVKKNLAEMITELKNLNPEVLLLQEVDFNSARSFHENQMEILAQGLGLPYAAYAVTWNLRYLPWPYWPPSRHFGQIISGQAILSRYPITQQQILLFPKPKENAFWYNWFYLNRLAQKVEIQWRDKILIVYNIHLEAFSQPTRLDQIKALAQQIQKNEVTDYITLGGGDFNAVWQRKNTQTDPADEQDRQALIDFIKRTGLQLADAEKEQFSFPSWDPQERIDLILYDGNFRLQSSGILYSIKASDHLPVWARFQKF